MLLVLEIVPTTGRHILVLFPDSSLSKYSLAVQVYLQERKIWIMEPRRNLWLIAILGGRNVMDFGISAYLWTEWKFITFKVSEAIVLVCRIPPVLWDY